MDSPPPWSCFPSPPFDAASTESTDAFRSVSSTPGPVTDSSPWSQPSPSLELLANNGQSPDVSGGWEYDTQAVWGDDSRMGLSMDSLRNVATNKVINFNLPQPQIIPWASYPPFIPPELTESPAEAFQFLSLTALVEQVVRESPAENEPRTSEAAEPVPLQTQTPTLFLENEDFSGDYRSVPFNEPGNYDMPSLELEIEERYLPGTRIVPQQPALSPSVHPMQVDDAQGDASPSDNTPTLRNGDNSESTTFDGGREYLRVPFDGPMNCRSLLSLDLGIEEGCPPKTTTTPHQSTPHASVNPMSVADVREVQGGASPTDDKEPRSITPNMKIVEPGPRNVASIRPLLEYPGYRQKLLVAESSPRKEALSFGPRKSAQDLLATQERVPRVVVPSIPSTGSVNAGGPNMKTDRTFRPAQPPSSQTRPLIVGPSVRNHYMQPNAPVGSSVNVCISPATRVPASSVQSARSSGIGPRLHNLGWIEYHLPKQMVYYTNPTRRIITDVDLRIDSTLDVITTFLKRWKDENLPQGTELWIREGPRSKQGFVVPTGWRVDHTKQVVHFYANEANKNAKRRNVETDDDLDMKCRYWAFIQAHPAHGSLPISAKVEAMDILTWVWTDRLLFPRSTFPLPFTLDECQELMLLLRSSGKNEQCDVEPQYIVQTRTVSRILFAVVLWQQQLHSLPHKPLLENVNGHDLHFPKHDETSGRPLHNLDLYLEIPYIFFKRHLHRRPEKESRLYNMVPMIVTGACACIIVLTFLFDSLL